PHPRGLRLRPGGQHHAADQPEAGGDDGAHARRRARRRGRTQVEAPAPPALPVRGRADLPAQDRGSGGVARLSLRPLDLGLERRPAAGRGRPRSRTGDPGQGARLRREPGGLRGAQHEFGRGRPPQRPQPAQGPEDVARLQGRPGRRAGRDDRRAPLRARARQVALRGRGRPGGQAAAVACAGPSRPLPVAHGPHRVRSRPPPPRRRRGRARRRTGGGRGPLRGGRAAPDRPPPPGAGTAAAGRPTGEGLRPDLDLRGRWSAGQAANRLSCAGIPREAGLRPPHREPQRLCRLPARGRRPRGRLPDLRLLRRHP
ncbi:conserved hypothetical protein, partial [Ricinus communis]